MQKRFGSWMTGWVAAACGFILVSSQAQVQPPSLSGGQVLSNGWFQFQILDPTHQVYAIERAASLSEWDDAAVLIGDFGETPLVYTDPDGGSGSRFYRVRSFPVAATNDWKNQVVYGFEPFLADRINWELPEVRWVKFAITTNEPSRVYYQDSVKYKFHYDFARVRLPEFQGMTPEEFESATLYTNGQKAVMGTLFYSPNLAAREIGVQFVGMDLYEPQQVADWFDAVRASVAADGPLKAVYIPSYEQRGAEGHRDWLSERGIELSTLARWDTGQNAYSLGWAVGRLKFVEGSRIAQAYASGELLPEDILLTDAVPAEVPFVAGIITLNPSTPNSHVAILARSYGVPFAWLADPALRARAEALAGGPVAFSALQGYPASVVDLIDLSPVENSLIEEIAGLKSPRELEITPKAAYGAYIGPTDDLVPADIQYFGGKASNFGFLRRELPENSSVSFGISFDLWDEFMDQVIHTGRTLREEIDERMAGHSYPANVAALAADLDEIRDLIEDRTSFTPAQEEAIIEVLEANFEPERKIRFRSSTNVEDSAAFTGAGLYDSYSGCLADDLDGDTAGPSHCDPEWNNERGVFRAIRRVYASFYNDNAVLERLRHGINEAEVGMAILVHYSVPDPAEMANGVATVTFQKSGSDFNYQAELVTQKGAVSVANPDGTAVPEVVRVTQFFTPYAETRQWSSLVPFGSHVLEWDDDYLAFTGMFLKVGSAFANYYPSRDRFTLDFEYKKIEPGVLDVKQVREIPDAGGEALPLYLVNQPGEWCLFQGEYGDVFGNHWLKSRWALTSRSLRLAETNLNETLLGPIHLEFLSGGEVTTMEGSVQDFPGAAHGVDEGWAANHEVWDSWLVDDQGTRWKLSAWVDTEASPGGRPVTTLGNMQLSIAAEYEAPQPGYSDFGVYGLVSEHFGMLRPCFTPEESAIAVSRLINFGDNGAIQIDFFWPPEPTGVVAGYTAPLAAWEETVITGLTTEPLRLRGYYSQTYRPGHHNFAEEFLFEPALEPGISSETLAELAAQDIRLIHVYWGGDDDQNRVSVIGADNEMRPLGGGK